MQRFVDRQHILSHFHIFGSMSVNKLMVAVPLWY